MMIERTPKEVVEILNSRVRELKTPFKLIIETKEFDTSLTIKDCVIDKNIRRCLGVIDKEHSISLEY
jgi:hypothetical protein